MKRRNDASSHREGECEMMACMYPSPTILLKVWGKVSQELFENGNGGGNGREWKWKGGRMELEWSGMEAEWIVEWIICKTSSVATIQPTTDLELLLRSMQKWSIFAQFHVQRLFIAF